MKAIADTGFLLALMAKRDKFHRWACEQALNLELPILTCESVVSETSFHLRNTALALGLIESGFLEIAFELGDHRTELAELARRYADLRPDLADLCLVRMSEIYPDRTILTVDSEFRIYRRNRRRLIPVSMPLE